MKNYEKASKINSSEIETFEGGKGYQMSFKETLAEFFSLGMLNGNFYQSEKEVIENASTLFERALKECPEFATKCAIYGNEVNSLKLVPTIWLVYLSKLENKTLFEKAFPRIIRNPKMLHDFVEISRKAGIRNGLGRNTKKVINKWLNERLNEYQVSRNKTKLKEVVRVTRPLPYYSKEFSRYMDYLIKDELSFQRAIALKKVLDDLLNNQVSDETLSLISENKLQLEELKHSTYNLSRDNLQKLYGSIYENLNYAALILNLVALERVFATETRKRFDRGFESIEVIETDIPQEIISMVAERISDFEAYRRSNMLPFALLNARFMVATPEFRAALALLLKKATVVGFDIPKETSLMVNVDTSGSMSAQVSRSLEAVSVAGIFGGMIKKSHTDTKVYAVATRIAEVPLKKQDDVFEMAGEIKSTAVGHGTYFEQIMKHYNDEDYVILITDSEGADDLEKKWRKRKNRKAKLIVWQLVPYGTVLSKDHSIVYVYGYSDRVLGQIKNIVEGKCGQIEEIEKITL